MSMHQRVALVLLPLVAGVAGAAITLTLIYAPIPPTPANGNIAVRTAPPGATVTTPTPQDVRAVVVATTTERPQTQTFNEGSVVIATTVSLPLESSVVPPTKVKIPKTSTSTPVLTTIPTTTSVVEATVAEPTTTTEAPQVESLISIKLAG